MLRFQQERVIPGVLNPKSNYQPPWTDKKFYLMDGAGNCVIIVDESANPRIYDEKDPERKDHLRPTAGYISQHSSSRTASNRIAALKTIPYINKVYQGLDRTVKEFLALPLIEQARLKEDLKLTLANPTIINKDWEIVVKNLKWNPFHEMPSQALLKCQPGLNYEENIKGKTDDIIKDDKCVIAQLPLEAWEILVRKLNGISFLRVCDALQCLGLDDLVWEAYEINTREKKLPLFWSRTCHKDMPSQLMNEIVTSYSNILINLKRRRTNFESLYNARESHNCRDVVFAEYSWIHKLRDGDMVVKNMPGLEKKIKTSIQLFHQKYPTFEEMVKDKDSITRNYSKPELMVGMLGSLCYYSMTTYNKRNLHVFIMDNLDKPEAHRVTEAYCDYDKDSPMLYSKLMYYPTHQTELSKTKNTEKLPEIDRLLFFVSSKYTTIRSVDSFITGLVYEHRSLLDDDVEALFSKNTANDDEGGVFFKMDPILAFNDNVFVLWHSPSPVEFNRVTRVRNHYEIHKIQSLRIHKSRDYWNLLSNYTQHFIPVLRKVHNSGPNKLSLTEEFLIANFGPGFANDCEYYYELQLINMRYGTDTISMRNANTLKSSTPPNAAKELAFAVHHQNPQYYYHNALEERSLLDVCYSACYGYDLYVFWNHKALAVSWGDGLIWIFHSWKRALISLKKEVRYRFSRKAEDLFVSHMCVCSREVLGVVVNDNVVIFKATKTPGALHDGWKEEPKLVMEPLRIIVLDLQSKQISVDQFSFHFDKGDPYFFLLLRDKGSKCWVDFWMQRLYFKLQEYEDSEVGVDIPEEVFMDSVNAYIENEERNRMKIQQEQAPTKRFGNTNGLTAREFTESIMQTIVGCKLVNLKRRVGVSDRAKTYKQMFDELMTRNKHNKDLFSISRHNALYFQVIRWVEKLQMTRSK